MADIREEESWTRHVRNGRGTGLKRFAVPEVGARGEVAAMRSLSLGGGGRRGAGAGRDGDGGAVHVEFLLAVEPGPAEDDIARGHISRDVEVEVLKRGVLTSLAVRAVAFPGGSDLPCVALVDGEADLAGSAVVVADTGQVEVLLAASGPGSDRGTLRGTELLEVATAVGRVFAATAVVRELEALVGRIGTVGVIDRAERGWVDELHVS